MSDRKAQTEAKVGADAEDRAGFVARMLKKYGEFMPPPEKLGVCASELGDVMEQQDKGKPGILNRADIELVFPTQMRSYYASSEL